MYYMHSDLTLESGLSRAHTISTQQGHPISRVISLFLNGALTLDVTQLHKYCVYSPGRYIIYLYYYIEYLLAW